MGSRRCSARGVSPAASRGSRGGQGWQGGEDARRRAMLYFAEPRRGVEAALELVHALTTDLDVPAHAGVDAGPVIERHRDLFGRTVNLAARVAARAGPCEIIVREAVVRSAGDGGFQFEPVDQSELKGFAEPVQLFRVS